MLLQLLLIVGFNSLDGAKYGLVCVCAHKQDCRFADLEGVHAASISLHACMRVHMYAMVCDCLYMCDIHLSHAQLPLCLLQLRGLLLSMVLHLHQDVILVAFVELQM